MNQTSPNKNNPTQPTAAGKAQPLLPNQAFSNFRMPTWEEDISLNHQGTELFENGVSPSEMPREAFEVTNLLTPELLAGVPLDDFIARDKYPIPPSTDREGYNPNQNATFFLNGLADYLKIKAMVKKHDVAMESYLDFGCASGRVLRHFCAQSDVQHIWGSDINGRHIKWLNNFLPQKLKIIHNHAIPNLQIADNSIDVISAFSVFTHIDIFETAWLAELYRILRPGGMVYLTVQNEASWKFIQTAKDDQSMRVHMRNVVPNFDEVIKQDLPDARLDFRHSTVGPYRALVFHSDAYLHRTWGRYFEIAEIIPRHHGYHQSVLIGRKA